MIKSASGREVKGKEAFKGGGKGFRLRDLGCVGLREEGLMETAGTEKTNKVGKKRNGEE